MEQYGENVSTLGLTITLLMGALLVFLPRRYAVLPVLMEACNMTLGQRLVIAGLNFPMMRVIIFFGWLRIVLRGELSTVRLNEIDKVVLVWAFSAVILYTLLTKTSEGFIYVSGFAYNSLGTFFLFRALIRDFDDVERAIKMIAILLIPLALAMINEKITGRNLYSAFGGVSEMTVVREGKLRAQGPFRHAILAGTVGATSLPLIFGLWFGEKAKMLGLAGLAAATMITVASASSGPVLAYLIAVIGLLLWPLRERTRAIQWTLLLLLLTLHMVMKAPVWFLISRMSEIIGGTGWHRSALIDAAIRYFHEWWLCGTTYTAHWMPYTLGADPTSADITNQFIWEGVHGGLLRMILFITTIVLCYRVVGRSRRIAEKISRFKEMTVWGLGVSLTAHVASYFSVTYFDQSAVFWYLLLASISAMTSLAPVKELSEPHQHFVIAEAQ